MAAVLMINVPFAGHTNPTLPLAEALARRGHKVSYINAEEFRGSIEKTGAEFFLSGEKGGRHTGHPVRASVFTTGMEQGHDDGRNTVLQAFMLFD